LAKGGGLTSFLRVGGSDGRDLAGNMSKGECCSGFNERGRPFISGKSSVTGDPLEAKSYTGEKGVEKVPKFLEELWLEKRWGSGKKEGKNRLIVS